MNPFFSTTPFKVSSKHEDKTVTQNVILLYILATKSRKKRAIVWLRSDRDRVRDEQKLRKSQANPCEWERIWVCVWLYLTREIPISVGIFWMGEETILKKKTKTSCTYSSRKPIDCLRAWASVRGCSVQVWKLDEAWTGRTNRHDRTREQPHDRELEGLVKAKEGSWKTIRERALLLVIVWIWSDGTNERAQIRVERARFESCDCEKRKHMIKQTNWRK